MGHLQVTKMYIEEKIYSIRTFVVVHIVNFQRDLVVMRFIRIELTTCSTSKVDGATVRTHFVHDVTQAKCLEFKIHIYIYIYICLYTSCEVKKPQVGLEVLSGKLGISRACP